MIHKLTKIKNLQKIQKVRQHYLENILEVLFKVININEIHIYFYC